MNHTMKNTALTLAFAMGIGFAPNAAAQVCEAPDTVQRSLSELRRLSLDLRGHVPTIDEQASVVTNGAIDPNIIDAMIDSDEFVAQIRKHHLDQLWTNLNALRLTNNVWNLASPNGRQRAPAYFLQANIRRQVYRGGPATCLDEPARFGPGGEILTTPDANNPGVEQEGWVEVEPYWAPGTTVRVCAFDAQDALTVEDGRGNQVDCSRDTRTRGCGCGPNLRWCQSGIDGTVRAITSSFNEQLLRYMDQVVRENRPYTDVILGKGMQLNGPLAFWLNNQTQTGGNVLIAAPLVNHDIPDIPFDQIDNWQEVTRTTRHAGVLSMPGYLLKFASDRGRANRFYNAFLCQHFESNEALPPATDECHAEPDLTKRCGCKGCHQAVEPAAAHWGRWAEAGLLALEAENFPKNNPQCATPQGTRNPLCRLFYFTQADVTDEASEGPYVGMLRSYVFADAEREAAIEAGPEAIAQAAVDSGQFASCTVEHMWRRFMSRDPNVAEQEVVDALAQDFSAGGYDLRSLVKAIVTRPEYVESGLFGVKE